MSTEENKAVARRAFEEIWNQGHLDLIGPVYSADFVTFGRPAPLDQFAQIVASWRTAVPDLHFSIDEQIAEGEQVASLCTVSGTHLGPFIHRVGSFPPTGKRFEVRHMHFDRVRAGRIVEHWAVRDDLTMLKALGAVAVVTEADSQ